MKKVSDSKLTTKYTDTKINTISNANTSSFNNSNNKGSNPYIQNINTNNKTQIETFNQL